MFYLFKERIQEYNKCVFYIVLRYSCSFNLFYYKKNEHMLIFLELLGGLEPPTY